MKKLLTAALAAFMIVAALPFAALAVDSPSPGEKPTLQVVSADANAGTVTMTEVGTNTYRVTATPANGYTFKNWTFEATDFSASTASIAVAQRGLMTLAVTAAEAPYTLVEGTLESSTVVIQINADILGTAYFEKTGDTPASGGGSSGGSTGGSTSPTSPATGDHAALPFAISAVALVGAVLVCKKILA